MKIKYFLLLLLLLFSPQSFALISISNYYIEVNPGETKSVVHIFNPDNIIKYWTFTKIVFDNPQLRNTNTSFRLKIYGEPTYLIYTFDTGNKGSNGSSLFYIKPIPLKAIVTCTNIGIIKKTCSGKVKVFGE